MTTKELRAYIDRTLGNSVRCLLPSYWWKRLFGAVVDKVEAVDTKVANLSVYDDSMSDISTNAVQNKVIKAYVDEQVATAITNTLNTAV